jgi:molecular chaperone GrpE
MTANPDTPENDPEETLAQRSARLEEEAAAMAHAQQDSMYDPNDPLSPEPHPEDVFGEDNAETEGDALDPSQAKAIIQALQAELETTKDQAVRAVAEAENTRRRAKKERDDMAKFAVTKFAKDMLDISDNLRRALEAVPADLLEAEPRIKNVLDGVSVTEATLLKTFAKHGITKIEPMDEPFNPNFHEVMFEAPVPGKAGGIVMQVLEPGYLLHDRLIRPARVGITKDDGTGGSEPPASGGHIDTSA